MTLIQRLLKIVYLTSILLICFWIMTAIFPIFIPLEFSNNEFESVFYRFRFYGFPIAIILTLTGTIKQKDSRGTIVNKLLTTFFISAISLFILFITVFAGMCDWKTDKVLYVNKQKPTTKIVQRSFGCGATDSSPAKVKVFKIREITPYFIWVTSIDTNQINKNEWKRIE